MYRRTLRRTVVAGAFALMAAGPLAACGGHDLAPLPIQVADSSAATTPPTAPPTTRAGSSPPSVTGPPAAGKPAHTTRTRTTTRPTTKPTSTCHGAVRYDLDLQNTELALVPSMCFR